MSISPMETGRRLVIVAGIIFQFYHDERAIDTLRAAALPHIFARVQAVIETPTYLSDAKAAGLSEEDRVRVVTTVAADPRVGVPIPGAGGARKIRFAGRGKGKSGGYRVVTFFGGEDIPVFLLGVSGKGDKANLSQAERNELRRELAGLAADYRRRD